LERDATLLFDFQLHLLDTVVRILGLTSNY